MICSSSGTAIPILLITGEDLAFEFGQREKLVAGMLLTIGGSAAITACGAARLGLRTAFVGALGDDEFGRFMLDAMSAADVDMSGVPGRPACADRRHGGRGARR